MITKISSKYTKNIEKTAGGFILVYTVLILSIIMLTGGIFINTVIKEISISRDQAESLKAFYAADSALECVRYYHNKNAFNTQTPQQSYSCGVGSPFSAGGNPPTQDCTSTTTTFTIDGFANGACADVTVETIATTTIFGGSPKIICTTHAISNGKNSCTAPANKLVERTRWETM